MESWKDKDSSNFKSYKEQVDNVVELFPELKQ
jgi:hypothetical protein